MVEEKIITKKEALLRIEADHLNQLLRPIFDSQDKQRAAVEQSHSREGFAGGTRRC